MLTPLLGIGALVLVLITALTQRASGELNFFDSHAAIVVFGGIIGSLLIAVSPHALRHMGISVLDLFRRGSSFKKNMEATQSDLVRMRNAWREDRRVEILELSDRSPSVEIRVAADALIRQLPVNAQMEKFTALRAEIINQTQPVMEAWDMVSRIAPSFGMVGTVSGMVQLFQNMGTNTGSLGAAMAMALVATLYGIATSAAIGGPMSSRLTNQLNERMTQLELIEKTTAALISENKKGLSGS